VNIQAREPAVVGPLELTHQAPHLFLSAKARIELQSVWIEVCTTKLSFHSFLNEMYGTWKNSSAGIVERVSSARCALANRRAQAAML
jgi:hypothetical protein